MQLKFNKTLLLAAALATVLALALVVGGCGGGSTKSLTPDPYDSLQVGTPETFEIATWNLENFAKAGSKTIAHAVKVIQAMDVDVVALQEIEDLSSFNTLVASLDGWSGFRGGGDSTWMQVAFVYRDSGPLQVDSVYEIMSSFEYRDPFPRAPLVLQGTLNGQPIVIINNHLKCCGDGIIDLEDDGDEETRRRDACVLLEQYVTDHFGGYQVIMVGDWNDELRDPEGRNVFQNFLDDTQGWRFTDLPIALNESALWSYPGWPSHLDHVLINAALFPAFEAEGSLIKVMPASSVVGSATYDLEVSDHLPVALRLVL